MRTPRPLPEPVTCERVTMPRDIARNADRMIGATPGTVLEVLPGYWGRREPTGEVSFWRLKSDRPKSDT